MPTHQRRQHQGRKQKGRRHRRVNRTPRPVTRTRQPQDVAPSAATGPSAAVAPPAVPAPTPAPAPQAVQPPQAKLPHPAGSPDEKAVFGPVSSGGIGRPAERTWRRLTDCGDTGASVDELSTDVGYQQATITRHVEGLAAHHLAHQRDGRWYAAQAGSA